MISGAFGSRLPPAGIGHGGLAKAILAWAAMGIPLSWGIWKTLANAAKIFL